MHEISAKRQVGVLKLIILAIKIHIYFFIIIKTGDAKPICLGISKIF